MRMSRFSRTILVMIAVPLFAVMFAVSIYLFVLNRRISRELVQHGWRQPTVILSTAKSRPEVARLWGVDWRVTPPVKVSELPPHVAEAFMAAEDVRFRRHPGVDPIGMVRALFSNIRAGGIREGGSTIDQQIIKARYLTQERTWRRKLPEIALAVLLDWRLSKNDILEIYLNEVYLGHHEGKPVLGIDQAARLYFNKPALRLRADEAALLASIVRAPNRDNPIKRPQVARARRDRILETMREHNWISKDEHRDAVSRPVDFPGGSLREPPFPYYLRAVRAEMVRRFGLRAVISGGLTIVCEVDPDAQRAAERAARRGARDLTSRHAWLRSNRRPLQVAILSVDPRTGGIRALVGGSDYNLSAFDRTTSMRRQPGSAFKTFAYLAAISSKRATTSSLLMDAPVKIELAGEKSWEPRNYDERFRGRVTLREAFEMSLNVPTVRLSQFIGVNRVVKTAERFGFEDDFDAVPALPLGVTEVSMRELTAAYTPFPTGGVRVEPYLIRAVRNAKGKTLYEHRDKPKRVVDAAPAFVMHSLLRGVVKRGTASRLRRYGLGYVAGKTGTTNDYRDAWFVGYTADMVTTAWVGFDDGAPLRLSSAEAAIPVWGTYMSSIPHDRDEPTAPPGVLFRDIDPESGMLWASGCPGPVREVYLEGTAPTRHCPRGLLGRIVRRIFFNDDSFDEPGAITADKVRRMAEDIDRGRKEAEQTLDWLRRIFD